MKGNMKGMEGKSWDMKDMKCMMCEDGFMVKSKDENEVMDMVKMHFKTTHQTEMADKEIKESMKKCAIEMKKWE